LADIRAALHAEAGADVALTRRGIEAGAAIDDVEAARTLDEHAQQLLRRRQLILGPIAGIVAVHDRHGAQLARAMRHVGHGGFLHLLTLGRAGALRGGRRSRQGHGCH
jgi:hypothetical protein